MSEHEFDLALLRQVRDLGVTPPDAQRLRAAVASAVAREAAGQEPRRSVSRRRFGGGRLLIPAVGIVVTIAVAVVALVGLGSGSRPTVSAAQAQGLLDRLAALRRPQMPADRLPPSLRLVDRGGNGSIVPGSARLVATLRGARVYLVVTRAPSGAPAPWSAGLGDRVSILTVTAGEGTESVGQPAVDLSDALELRVVFKRPVLLGRRPGPGRPQILYQVGVVPDGVARATWRFRVERDVRGFAEPTTKTVVVHPHIADNIAYARVTTQRLAAFVGAAWYAADGTRIPTSDAALRDAVIRRQQIMRLQALHEVQHNTYRASPQLLRAFSVFGVTSRTGVVLSNGVRVSDPSIASLPSGVLNVLEPNDTITEPDTRAVRQVTMPSGVTFYVVAGAGGLCAVDGNNGPASVPLGDPALAGLYGGGGGEGCNSSITNALKQGTGVTSGGAAGYTTITVRPNAHPYMTIGKGTSRRTFAPPDGVYATFTPITARS